MTIQAEGISIQRGTKKFERIQVITEMGDGSDLAIPVHIVGGVRPGPTLLLAAFMHGHNATYVVDAFKYIVEKTKVEDLSGSVIALPVCNPNAFEMHCTRFTFLDVFFGGPGSTDMNRVFPGKREGSLSHRLAWTISENIIKKVDLDCIIQFCPPRAMYKNVKQMLFMRGLKTADRAQELSKIFGYEINLFIDVARAKLAGSLDGYASTLGIPTLVPEFGSEWYEVKENIETAVRGIQNVMKYLGMIEGDPILPKKQYVFNKEDVTGLRARNGGLFRPESGTHGLELAGTVVTGKRQTLARIISPYTFEELERFETPYEENLIISSRIWAPVVPGESTYKIANMKKAQWIRRQ